MKAPKLTRARQQFIDDEMLRVPLLAEQLLDAAIEDIRVAMAAAGPQERAVTADLMRKVDAWRPKLVDRFASSVRTQVLAETGGGTTESITAATKAPVARQALALLDEDEIATDVELSHALEAIKSVAEHELREMATFASALAGDMDMGGDHNPFRAETYARALWDCAQSLPMSRAFQVRLMRHASQPLAQLLRKAYAGACARLESAGVEPAVYRTVILAAGGRSMRPGDSWLGRGPDLNQMRDSMPAPLDAGQPSSQVPLDRVLAEADHALRALPADAPLTERARLLSAQRSRIVRHTERAVDQRLIELLSRLFDAILADNRVPRDVQVTLSRLQPAVMRLALRDTGLLDDYVHPVWRFMDQIAHLASLLPEQSQPRQDTLRYAESLIDKLAAETAPDVRHYRWGLDRLAAADLQRLEARVRRVAPDIATLQSLEDKLANLEGPLSTGAGPLDETQLETVPAALMDDLPAPRADAPDVKTWLDERQPGDWIRMFHQGQWMRAQLLWQGQRGDAWLFGEIGDDVTRALRRRALERLYDEGLANSVRARSLVRAAAERIIRAANKAQSG